jgi:hypothetical protein
MWTKIVDNIRQERLSEFAPPQAYDKTQKSKKKHQPTSSNKIKIKERKLDEYVQEQINAMAPRPQLIIPHPFMFPPPNFMMPPPSSSLLDNIPQPQTKTSDIPIPPEDTFQNQ